jgi:Cytochrome P450
LPNVVDLVRINLAAIMSDWLVAMHESILVFTSNSFLLVRHPEVLNRLREEIKTVLEGEQDISRALINKMIYLRCVLNES